MCGQEGRSCLFATHHRTGSTKTTSDEGCTDPSGGHPSPPTGSVDQAAHIARTCRPIANAIEPPCKPGGLKTWSLLFCKPVPWHLAQEACACMHRPAHGQCIMPNMHGPSADAEETMAEPYWATCPARARMRKCMVFCLHSVNTQGGACRIVAACALGAVYATKASPRTRFGKIDVSYWFWRSSCEPRRRRAKRLLCAF